MATPSINTVPADVVLEIMARLPVKSVMRLRLISKSFFSITAAPNFIRSHLAVSKSSGYIALPARRPQSFIAILDKSFSEVLRPEIPFSRSKSDSDECIYFLVGSCNGLLCVTYDCVTYNGMVYLGRFVVLWNPMIGKLKFIIDTSLDSNMLCDRRTKITLGFGYDEKNDDYKIIRIVIPFKTGSSAQAEIYSLKTNSWKRVIFPINYSNNILLIESDRCAFVHGALHWLVYLLGVTDPFNNPFIVSFKIDDEQFKVIKLPQNHERGPNFSCYVDLMALKESLALTIYDEDPDEETEGCRVWKMKKYEEVESWTKQILPMNDVFKIYGFTEDGELMFSKDDFEVSLYNLDSGALKESFMVAARSVVLFRESLVLL